MPNDKLEILVKSIEKRQATVDKVIEQLRAMVAKGSDDKKIDEIEKRVIAIEAALKKILAKQADDLAKSETKAAKDLVNSEIKAAQKISYVRQPACTVHGADLLRNASHVNLKFIA
jgi:hypothetical protein